MEDYVFDLQYHSGKANVVASIALKNWKTYVTIREFDLQFCQEGDRAYICNIVATPSLIQQVKQGQW